MYSVIFYLFRTYAIASDISAAVIPALPLPAAAAKPAREIVAKAAAETRTVRLVIAIFSPYQAKGRVLVKKMIRKDSFDSS